MGKKPPKPQIVRDFAADARAAEEAAAAVRARELKASGRAGTIKAGLSADRAFLKPRGISAFGSETRSTLG